MKKATFVSEVSGSVPGRKTGMRIGYDAGVPFEAFPEDVKGYEGILEVKAGAVAQPEDENPESDNRFEELPEDTEFPYHYGAGNYFLSNGESVKGKDKALEAEAALQSEPEE